MSEREWKNIAGYEGKYIISNDGLVVSLPRKVSRTGIRGDVFRKGKMLKPHLRGRNNLKYLCVTLSDNGISKAYSVHRLVAQAFLENPNNFEEVNHIDKNTFNNRLDNLEWCDRQYNNAYSHNKAIVRVDDDGMTKEYKSIRLASEDSEVNVCATAITNCLKGRTEMAGGYKWRYA